MEDVQRKARKLDDEKRLQNVGCLAKDRGVMGRTRGLLLIVWCCTIKMDLIHSESPQ